MQTVKVRTALVVDDLFYFTLRKGIITHRFVATQ